MKKLIMFSLILALSATVALAMSNGGPEERDRRDNASRGVESAPPTMEPNIPGMNGDRQQQRRPGYDQNEPLNDDQIYGYEPEDANTMEDMNQPDMQEQERDMQQDMNDFDYQRQMEQDMNSPGLTQTDQQGPTVPGRADPRERVMPGRESPDYPGGAPRVPSDTPATPDGADRGIDRPQMERTPGTETERGTGIDRGTGNGTGTNGGTGTGGSGGGSGG